MTSTKEMKNKDEEEEEEEKKERKKQTSQAIVSPSLKSGHWTNSIEKRI